MSSNPCSRLSHLIHVSHDARYLSTCNLDPFVSVASECENFVSECVPACQLCANTLLRVSMVKWLGGACVVASTMSDDWEDWEAKLARCPAVTDTQLLNKPWIVPCAYDGYWSKRYCRQCNREASSQHVREDKHMLRHFTHSTKTNGTTTRAHGGHRVKQVEFQQQLKQKLQHRNPNRSLQQQLRL